jgi:DNA-binding SARP family transcriptional activator
LNRSGQARLNLLGGFELRVHDEVVDVPAGSQRLLALVALRGGTVARADAVSILWGDRDAHRANANLRAALWRIPVPARSLIEAGRASLSLEAVACDVHEVEALALALADHGSDTALPLHVDLKPFLLDLLPANYEDWALEERERLRGLCLGALVAMCRRLSHAQRHSEAIEAGILAVAADPLREAAHSALIDAHLAEGNRHDAEQQFARCRAVLQAELGVEPSFHLPEPRSGSLDAEVTAS